MDAGGICHRDAIHIDCSDCVDSSHDQVNICLRQSAGTDIELPLECPRLGGCPPQDQLIISAKNLWGVHVLLASHNLSCMSILASIGRHVNDLIMYKAGPRHACFTINYQLMHIRNAIYKHQCL